MTREYYSPRDIHWAYLLAFLLFKIIGLAPFSVQWNNSARKSLGTKCAFIGTKVAMLYNLLLFCMAVSIFATIPSRYYSDYSNRNRITTNIETVLATVATLMMCIVLMCYCKNQSTLVRIGNHFIQVETELCRLRKPIDRKRTVCLLLLIYLFQLGMVAAILITYQIAFEPNPVVWLTDVMPTAFAAWILTQYFSVLTFVNATFANVNGFIQSLCRGCSYCNRSMPLYQYRRVVVTSSSIKPLLRFRDIHDHLCNISDDISEFYSLPVLACVSYIFFQFLYGVYYLVTPLVEDNTGLDSLIAANTLLWLILLVYPLSLLTTKTTNTAKEIGKTRVSVHALLNYTIDEETKAELRQFSLQLLQRKIKFTASGYFVLDNKLLQTMFGAVATYVIILIQFEMAATSSAICHCNCTRE